MKHVFVLGGTGLLGYHTVKELLKQGYAVSTIARNEAMMADLLPQEVECHTGDINEMTDEQILDLLTGKEMFIYAAGIDERTVPEAPAVRFYYEQNVLPTQRIARLARTAGVKRFVIFGSYHAHFAEKWPDLDLEKGQAYTRTRLLQEEIAFLEGEGAMAVMSLRLPYIFGTMPGREPLWKRFVPQVQGKKVVPVLGGGTAMVTVKQVAEAAIGALEYGEHGKAYAISGMNMKYSEFYQIIADVLGQKDTTIQVVPLEEMKPAYAQIDEKAAANGKELAIHAAKTAELQNRDAYIDPEETMPILHYQHDDIKASIIETMKKCID